MSSLFKAITPATRSLFTKFVRQHHKITSFSNKAAVSDLQATIFYKYPLGNSFLNGSEEYNKQTVQCAAYDVNSHVDKLASNLLSLDLSYTNKNKVYEIPPVFEQVYEMPVLHNLPEIDDHRNINSINEGPNDKKQQPMQAGKMDIAWRRRRMKRHRLLRWRKKHRNLYTAQQKRKLERRKRKREAALKKSWKMFGLEHEPPKLSEEEKVRLQQEWREQGIWDDPLSIEEYKNYDKITKIMKETDIDGEKKRRRR